MLSPEDMINPHIDELSMMTYLSQFPEAKPKPGAPIGEKDFEPTNSQPIEELIKVDEEFYVVESLLEESSEGKDVSKVKVFGSGISGDQITIGNPAQIHVDCTESGIAEIIASVKTPLAETKTVVLQPEVDRPAMFVGAYEPNDVGCYQVAITFDGMPINNSPFTVLVKNPSKVNISGSGITGEVAVGALANIIVDCSQSGIAPVTAKVQTPSGETKEVDLKPKSKGSSVFIGSYNPTEPGNYTMDVTFDGEPVPDSPYKVNINDIDKVKVSGPGVTGDGAKIGEPAKIIVDCSESGVAPVTAMVKTPSGETQVVKFEPTTENPNIFEGTYEPKDNGNYEVAMAYDGEPFPNSPIKVPIKDPSKVKVSGSGVTRKGANVGQPAEIIVDCSDSGVAPVSAKVTTPSGDTQDIVFKPTAPGSSVITGLYTPSETGDYNVEVDFDGEPVQDSPYKVNIKDIDKVKVSGPGVTGEGAKVGEPAKIIVDCSESGVAPVSGKVKTPSGEKEDVKFEPTTENPNIFEGSYEPKDAGDYEVALDFDERPLPNSPIKVPIRDITKVKVSGSGISGEGARVGQPANIIVDCSDSGVAYLSAKVTNPSGDIQNVPLKPNALDSNVFLGSYSPIETGTYNVVIEFHREPVKDSPYRVNIKDINNVKVSGPGVTGKGAKIDEPAKIIVDCSKSGVAPVTAMVKTPSGETQDVTFEPTAENPNIFEGAYEPKDSGNYEVAVDFDGEPLPNSPIKVSIKDPSKVKVSGSGVTGKGANVGQPAEITVDCSDSGVAPVSAKVTTPSGDTQDIVFKPTAPGSSVFTGSYAPSETGDYNVEVDFDGKPVQDSPYKVNIKDIDKVKVSGPGVTGEGAKVGEPAKIIVDCSESGVAPVSGKVKTPSGEKQDVKFEPTTENPNIFEGSYEPKNVGDYEVALDFDERPLPNSSIKVPIRDITKVKVGGSGITGEGARVGQPANIIVDCSDSGVAYLSAKVTNPSGDIQNVPLKPNAPDSNVFLGSYSPIETGTYNVVIEFHREPVKDSPYRVNIKDINNVKVSGPGVTGKGAKIDEPAKIIVDCSESGVAPVTAMVKTPSGETQDVTFEPTAENPNIFEGAYEPKDSGNYDVAIDFDGEPLPNSPIKVSIKDPSKVKVSGSGVTGKGANVGQPAEIIVDCSDSGVAPVSAKVTTPSHDTQDVVFKPTAPGSSVFTGSYAPSETGDYNVEVDFNEEPVQDSPYRINIKDINKVKVSGPGVTGEGAKVGEPAKIIVDCSESGVAPVSGKVKTSSGEKQDVKFEPTTENPNIFEGSYEPKDAGDYEVALDFDERPLPNSPIKVPIRDITKVKMSGSGISGEGARVGQHANIIVDCSDSGVAPVTSKVTTPSGNTQDVTLQQKPGPVYEGFYTPKEPGYYGAEVEFNGEAVPDSPYQVPIGKPEAVRIGGDGLEMAFVGEDNIIDVFTDEAGPGDVSVKFIGQPTTSLVVESIVKVNGNHHQVHFSPHDPGVYDANVCFGGFPIENKAHRIHAIDLDRIKLAGPGISSNCKENVETFFNIKTPGLDPKQFNGKICVFISDSAGSEIPHVMLMESEDSYRVTYCARSSGNINIVVKYAKRELKGCPYLVMVDGSGQAVTKTRHNAPEPQYSIVAPLHIAVLVFLVGLMDKAIL